MMVVQSLWALLLATYLNSNLNPLRCYENHGKHRFEYSHGQHCQEYSTRHESRFFADNQPEPGLLMLWHHSKIEKPPKTLANHFRIPAQNSTVYCCILQYLLAELHIPFNITVDSRTLSIQGFTETRLAGFMPRLC